MVSAAALVAALVSTPLAALQLAVGRRYPLSDGHIVLFATPEAKITASTARVPLGERGSMSVPNVAVHLLGGVGVVRRR